MLLINPWTGGIRWCFASPHGRLKSEFHISDDPSPDFFSYLARTQVVVLRLPHGGDLLPETAGIVDARILPTLRQCAEFLPAANAAVAAVARICFERRGDATFVLLNDTALYSHLPMHVKALGLPHHFLSQGIHRYGADGICFEWLWRRLATEASFSLRRWIGVHIDEQSTVSAFEGEKPVDTSAGLSPVDGVPGLNSCGTLDPAIPLLMSRSENAEEHLSGGSGLAALVDWPVTLDEILDAADPETAAARDVLEHHLVHHLGAMMAALDGTDTIVFTSSRLDAALPLIYSLCRRLAFCGLSYRALTPGSVEPVSDLTTPQSKVTVLAVQYDPWLAMHDLANSVLHDRGDR